MIIYLVTNTIDGKRYVGKTNGKLSGRRWAHSRNSSYLGNAIRCYGIEAFTWEEIDSAGSVEELNEKEIEWIKKLDTLHPNGYNLHAGGGSIGGWKSSEETKRAISFAYKGRKLGPRGPISEEHRKVISQALMGTHRSEETKRKISETLIGSRRSEETKRKISETLRGRKR